MFQSISEFLNQWEHESSSTQKVLDALTDASLRQQVSAEGRDLGRIAWHVVASLHEMISKTGLLFEGATSEQDAPTSAKKIADQYRQTNEAMVSAIKEQWNDQSLKEEHDMFGRQMPNGASLLLVILHQTHHRGQMTVLMRQAGLKVPGIYGPSQEEWSAIGMEPPKL
ncbi:DinB family protein [Heyndrickxia camelliae]|uniref:Damage-inducible protein DinB n=1 Tax=Heyndrickxia camelliae TaxID=1707093 RepID=A0A2N3LI01_9BACI|nr:DinB family protein [Heyndrickxia camelliae]PKR84231.1 hypothetical protein CWO92_15630 [Heyndrickxia camelliae]